MQSDHRENSCGILDFEVWSEAAEYLRSESFYVHQATQRPDHVVDASPVEPTTRNRAFIVGLKANAAADPENFRWPAQPLGTVDFELLPPMRPHLLPAGDIPHACTYPIEEFERFPTPRRREDGALVLGFLRRHPVLSPDGPCATLRAQVAKAKPPGSVTGLLFDGVQVRNLLVPEALSIMGYPRNMLDDVPEDLGYLLVGNSVPRYLLSRIVKAAKDVMM